MTDLAFDGLVARYLDGDLSPEDVEALDREIRRSAEAADRYWKIAKERSLLRDVMQSGLDVDEGDAADRRRPSRRQSAVRRARRRVAHESWRPALIAAGILLALGFLLFVIRSRKPERTPGSKHAAARSRDAGRGNPGDCTDLVEHRAVILVDVCLIGVPVA